MLQQTHSRIVISALMGIVIAQNADASTIENAVDASVGGTIAMMYGDHTIDAFVSSTGTGSYSLNGASGDDLRIVVAGQSPGFDPMIELRNPTGAILQTTSCGAGSGLCSVGLDETLSMGGTHFINVTDAGLDNSGDYTLHLDLFPPSDPLGNNWDGLGYGSLVSDSLGHLGDHDMFGFWGSSNTGISVNVDGLSPGMDSHLQLWGPSGQTPLDDNSCGAGSGTCSTSVSADLAEDGIYFIGLFDQGWDNAGNYALQLACTYGSCPVSETPPPAIPVPAALPLFATGLLGMIGVARRKKAA